MTTLAVAFFSTAHAHNVGVAAPRPFPGNDCTSSWDCEGDSVYCWQHYNGNYCAYGDGIGSLCENDSGCGWLGYGSSARKMYCSQNYFRRGEVGVAAPRPNPNTSGTCVDPWGHGPIVGGRRLDDDDTKVGMPNPHSNTGCEDSRDCEGDSVYCLPGNPNFCEYGNGIGSICVNSGGCGWLGQGSSARKMYCDGGECVDPWGSPSPDYGRRLDGDDITEEATLVIDNENEQRRAGGQLAAPRPAPRQRGCQSSWDCDGDSVYCYEGWFGRNYCKYGNGIGSLCGGDSACGWLGRGSSARKMYCSNSFRRGDDGMNVSAPRPAPRPRGGRCRDPWNGGGMVGGRRLDDEQGNLHGDESVEGSDSAEGTDSTVVAAGLSQDTQSDDVDSADSNDAQGSGMGSGMDSVEDSEDDSNKDSLNLNEDSNEDSNNQDSLNDDSDDEMRRAQVQAPNPHSNTGCLDSWDCDGDSVYCYRGRPRNFCRRGNGIGSLCRNHSGCGWLGRGSSARKMTCTRRGTCRDPWGNGRRALEQTMEN